MNLADYEYQVRAPAATGVEANSHGRCMFAQSSAGNSSWVTAAPPVSGNYKGVFLTRCGFGDGTTKLEIWLRHKSTGYVFTSASYSEVMREPWHRANNKVTYAFALPLVVGDSSLPQATLDMFKDSTTEGADAWNSSSADISFSRTPVANTYDVIVQGYSTKTSGFDDKCGDADALACVDSDDRIANHVYPHLDKQTLYFENPPQNTSGTKFLWTNNRSRASTTTRNNEFYLYMPAFMMHEFGHTAGLDHSLHVYDIMSHLVYDRLRALTNNDKEAMKNLYNNNHHATN